MSERDPGPNGPLFELAMCGETDGAVRCDRHSGHAGPHAGRPLDGQSLELVTWLAPVGFLDFARDHLEDRGGVACGIDLGVYGDYVAAENGMGC